MNNVFISGAIRFISRPKISTVQNTAKIPEGPKSNGKSKYTDGQIAKAHKEEENGRSVMVMSRELGINKQNLYNWRKKYADLRGEHFRQLKQLYGENVQLIRLYTDVSLDDKMLKDVLSKKW